MLNHSASKNIPIPKSENVSGVSNPWSWMLLLPGHRKNNENPAQNDNEFQHDFGLSNSLPTKLLHDSREMQDFNDLLHVASFNSSQRLRSRSIGRLPPQRERSEGEILEAFGVLEGEANDRLNCWNSSSPFLGENSSAGVVNENIGLCKEVLSFSVKDHNGESRDSDVVKKLERLSISSSLKVNKSDVFAQESPSSSSFGLSAKKRNMTQGRKEQRRRAMVRRAMRHLLEWPLDKQEKCNRNYGLLIIEVPEHQLEKPTEVVNGKQSFVLPCKEVRKLCCCENCSVFSSSSDENSTGLSDMSSGPSSSGEIRAKEIVHYEIGVMITWNDGHSSQHTYAELVSLHSQILNVSN